MQFITVDFETYYDKDYSLRKLTTEEYVRDARFQTQCVAVKIGDGATRVLDNYQFIQFARLVDWTDTAVVMQHAHFDAFILFWHYEIRPAFIFCTLSMAQLLMPTQRHGLHALAETFGLPVVQKAGLDIAKGKRHLAPQEYQMLAADCARDADLTWAIFQKLLPHFPREELRVVDMTVRMFSEPAIDLDQDRLRSFHFAVKARKEKFLAELGVTREQLQSSEIFAGLLRRLGVEPPTKPSPTNGEPIYAFAKTDEAMSDLCEHPDERVQALAGARLGVKSTLEETRSERLLGMAGRGAAPVYLKYCGAHTTRWSGGDGVNWQNFPRPNNDGTGGEIRKSVMAPKGHQLIVADLAQIECRVVNWLAGQQDMLDRFASGADPYTPIASQYYGRLITKADKEERQLGKTIELACGFGMGGARFQVAARNKGVALSDGEAQRGVDIYRQTHPRVVELWKLANACVEWLAIQAPARPWGPMTIDRGSIWLPNGAPLHYREMEQYDDPQFGRAWRVKVGRQWRKLYGAKLVENVVQALARVILSQAMLRIIPRYRTLMCAHDEAMFLAPAGDTDALPFVLAEMKKTPEWAPGLPLDAEGFASVRYEK